MTLEERVQELEEKMERTRDRLLYVEVAIFPILVLVGFCLGKLFFSF